MTSCNYFELTKKYSPDIFFCNLLTSVDLISFSRMTATKLLSERTAGLRPHPKLPAEK